MKTKKAFTLTEIMVVVAIMSALMAAVIPSLGGFRTAANVSNSAYEIASALQRARTYAMTHNTYVWVGFREENPAIVSAAGGDGVGRVLVAMAASVDGTQIVEDSATVSVLPEHRVKPLEKLLSLDNVHLDDLSAPNGSGTPGTLDGRPDADSEQCRLGSDACVNRAYTVSLFNRSFSKIVRFSPNGEACINGETDLPRVGEIGLRPTQGSRIDTASPNVAAVQFTGAGGNVEIYRR